MRTFIAIELTPDSQAALTKVQGQLKATLPPNLVRWTAVPTIHLTLHFLGEIESKQVATVAEAMQASAATMPAFTLQIAQLGCFPNLTKPRIVWVGVAGEVPLLQQLQLDLGRRLQTAINFQPESRAYSPHLTLGRVKDGVTPSALRQLGQAIESRHLGHLADLPVTALTLMQSELRPSGPIYTPLAHGALG